MFLMQTRLDLGYEGTGVSGDCTDVDECSSNVCPDNSNCANSVGSYTCECVYGYEEDGDDCVEINECDLGNDCSQVCRLVEIRSQSVIDLDIVK